jgi:asparagine synthase (glutamine-hydrolysing)
MSTIVAVFCRNGAPVIPETVEAMLVAGQGRAIDGMDQWIQGSVAMGHQHFWITPEEVGERQPLVADGGNYAIVCSARLDNRHYLITTLDLHSTDSRSVSDASLILQAYRRWGTATVDHLLGDYTFVIWDAQQQHLFIARDALGSREVCYYLDRHTLLVASEPGQILAHPAVQRRLNEGRVAEYLAYVWDNHEETFYQGINFCPPAHCLLVTPESLRQWRHWDIDPKVEIHYRDDREYAEHFHSLLTEAVRCRLRTVGPVGISLSGGLDSATIAALAATLLPECLPQQAHLKSFSYVFAELFSCDESRYIKPLVERYGIDAAYILSDDKWPLKNYPGWPSYRDNPAQDNMVLLTIAVLRAASTAGCRLLLTGLFGDHLFSGGDFWAADMIRHHRWSQLLVEIRSNKGTAVNWQQEILLNGFRPLAPAWLKRAYLHLRPISIEARHPGLQPSFAARTHLQERSLWNDRLKQYPAPGQWPRYRVLTDHGMSQGNALIRQLASQFGIDYAHPFFDRRLVEFIMAIPAYQLDRPRRKKWLLRNTMADFLPEVVSERVGKTSLNPLSEKGLLHEEQDIVRKIFDDPQIVKRGFVRGDWLRQELDAGRNWLRNGHLLWLSLSLEIWLDRYW